MTKMMTRTEAEARLISRAWKDEAFRRQLLENPKAAVGEELGVEFEDDAQVVVHQEAPNSLHIVLPVKPALIPEMDEGVVFVRDRAGIFYEIPAAALADYAVSEPEHLQIAVKVWKGEEPDVEGQTWPDRHPFDKPWIPCCGVRG